MGGHSQDNCVCGQAMGVVSADSYIESKHNDAITVRNLDLAQETIHKVGRPHAVDGDFEIEKFNGAEDTDANVDPVGQAADAHCASTIDNPNGQEFIDHAHVKPS